MSEKVCNNKVFSKNVSNVKESLCCECDSLYIVIMA